MALLRYLQSRDDPDTFLGKFPDDRSAPLYYNSVSVCSVPCMVLVRAQEFRQQLFSKSLHIRASRERNKLVRQYRLPCLIDAFRSGL